MDHTSEKPGLEARLRAALEQVENADPEREDPYAEVDVRGIRLRLGLTQSMFAGVFGFPVATLRHCERGNRRPTGTALVLLHVIREHPRAVLTVVRKLRRERAGLLAPAERRAHRRPPRR